MERDAFTGGVEPGGLWNRNDIRILLCYVLTSINAPLSGEDLTGIVQGKALANYFEAGDALASLVQQGHVVQDENGFYNITETGREIARSLDASLPLTVRDKALESAFRLKAEARARREHRVEVLETDRGYQLTCHISGGSMELMSISLHVPDRAQVELVERSFFQDPTGIYRAVLDALIPEKS